VIKAGVAMMFVWDGRFVRSAERSLGDVPVFQRVNKVRGYLQRPLK
jgi:hypothetical protein